ncbi:hypothetical protein BS17DRAFT_782582 [Gyrodon lividus]|nr:hypothetical protein BS17DRAFT_782582 [Gyrodon lividus]
MSDAFTLNCWVRGTHINQYFCVTIPRTETVDGLKTLLKEHDTTIDVPALALRLYKPRDPMYLPLENLRSFVLSEHAKILDGSDELLSEVFPAPPLEHHIHIIVDAPFPEIFYWFRGADISQDSSFNIHSNETISTFKKQLTKRHVELGNVPTAWIRPYMILEDNIEEYLGKLDAGKSLDKRQTIADCFADIPVLQTYCVVIQISDTNPSDRVIAGEDLIDEADPIKVARNEFLRSRPLETPSDASRPTFRGLQRNSTTQILCGRPRDPEETIPATLLHPVFGHWQTIMSEVCDIEKERVDKINAELARYEIGLRVTMKKGTEGYQLDGNLSVAKYRYVIAEFKNDAGASVSEPYIQAAAHYLERTRTQALENTGTSLPCLLLVVFGPYIVFAGAAWNLRPTVQVLSTPLAFHYHSTDTDTQFTVARHMAAFRKSVRSLKQYYEGMPADGLANTLSHPSLFPYPTSYTSLIDNSEKTFRYRERVKDNYKLIFFGTLVEDLATEIPICIKFVRRYSREAHLCCAQSGFAPTLRGFGPIPGGWFMVVMDELVGYKSLADLTDRLPKSVFEAIRIQLNQLHSGGFVHGDVRDANIMVRKAAGGTFELMIIDFDWAGEVNAARYPPYVNRNGIDRPDDADDGELILAVHDHWMLDDMIKKKGK